MKQVQKKHSAWLQTLLTVVLSVLIASAVWIGRYGVPLLGLPKAEDVPVSYTHLTLPTKA